MTKLGKILTLILSILLCTSIAVGSWNSARLHHQNDVLRNNLTALTDMVNEFELKNGELIQWNQALIVDKEALSDSLTALDLSKREIERTLNSKIRSLTNIISKFKADTIVVTDSIEILPDSIFTSPFEYYDTYLSLSGRTYFNLPRHLSETHVNELSVIVPIRLGLTDDHQVFVTSPNPDVYLTQLNSLELDTKKYNRNRLGLGLYTGFGFQYGLLERKIDVGPQIGLGLHWRIF